MKNTYLLYIDILGFGRLAKDKHREARRLYHILESLNVHRHHAFRVIIFSDTILIYSAIDPLVPEDHRYLVMFSIEFAQNLLYTTIGKNFYFRSVLTYGEFEHSSVGRVDRFFGPALVNAYEAEKAIGCTGLFIDRHCQRYNDIFETAPWSEDFSFVFLNQSLERLARGSLGEIPIQGNDLWNSDEQWNLCKDVRMLHDIHQLMGSHPNPTVRAKFLASWNFYYARYPELLHQLATHDFALSVISPGFDWTPAKRAIRDGYRGFGISPPSVPKFRRVVAEARAAGRLAARKKLRQIGGASAAAGGLLGPIGDASMILDVDGRSALGRFLLSHKVNRIKNFDVWKNRGGLCVSLGGLTSRQERAIREPSSAAALEVLKRKLDVDGYLEMHWD